ncbi:hypothetical protein [Jiangella alba]|uniref:LPXTG-motif cell wall anchor domain-containing protein n=1 Tax=Jiangella alba TaxID=561176 RepID=A0A1H5PN73_9ACTN|nr:hypothetical protein [Jiangella alba]SEF15353.1 hypothetical protein SAMN04488561_4931 [Jiangella alba]
MTRRAARRALTAGVAAAVLPLAASGAAAAAPALGEVTATVEVDEQGAAQVELTYVVDGGDGPDDTTSLSFSALDFGGDGAGPVDDLEVTSADGEQLDTSVETADLKTTVTVTLDEPLAAGAETTLTLRYTALDAGVVDGDRMTTEVPVLVFDLPAATTAPGVFAATVRLAPGYDYVEGFPANPERVSASEGRTEIAYELPAAPSLLRSVATTGDAPLLTLGGWVNLALFLTLLAGGAALALSFTRGRARAAEERDDATPATEPAGRRH